MTVTGIRINTARAVAPAIQGMRLLEAGSVAECVAADVGASSSAGAEAEAAGVLAAGAGVRGAAAATGPA
jgi:hypothetical protein